MAHVVSTKTNSSGGKLALLKHQKRRLFTHALKEHKSFPADRFITSVNNRTQSIMEDVSAAELQHLCPLLYIGMLVKAGIVLQALFG